jgi:hypothetical protein
MLDETEARSHRMTRVYHDSMLAKKVAQIIRSEPRQKIWMKHPLIIALMDEQFQTIAQDDDQEMRAARIRLMYKNSVEWQYEMSSDLKRSIWNHRTDPNFIIHLE